MAITLVLLSLRQRERSRVCGVAVARDSSEKKGFPWGRAMTLAIMMKSSGATQALIVYGITRSVAAFEVLPRRGRPRLGPCFVLLVLWDAPWEEASVGAHCGVLGVAPWEASLSSSAPSFAAHTHTDGLCLLLWLRHILPYLAYGVPVGA